MESYLFGRRRWAPKLRGETTVKELVSALKITLLLLQVSAALVQLLKQWKRKKP